MAHFQVPDDRQFHNAMSELQPWPGSPQGYQLFIGDPGSDQKIGIHTRNEIVLQQVGFDATGKMPVVWSSDRNIAEPLRHPQGVQGDKQTFIIRGNTKGHAILTAKDATGKDVAGPLHIVVGTFENDPRLAVDLIAEVGRSSDSLKIHAIQRMLFNNADNIFEQNAPFNRHNNPKIGNMACGIVAKFRGDQVFGHMTTVDYDHPYHEPLKKSVTKRSDVKYKAKTISSLQTQIVAMLNDEPPKPVRVGVLDDPVGMALVNGKLIAYLAGGHSVLIVGCNGAGTQFLYIDPWGDGSKMEYKGGIAGFTPTGKCRQLGMFELVKDETRLADENDKGRWTLMRQTTDSEGTFNAGSNNFLEAVAGPWRF